MISRERVSRGGSFRKTEANGRSKVLILNVYPAECEHSPLYYYEDLTMREICANLNLSESRF
jgi:hypothetical protein